MDKIELKELLEMNNPNKILEMIKNTDKDGQKVFIFKIMEELGPRFDYDYGDIEEIDRVNRNIVSVFGIMEKSVIIDALNANSYKCRNLISMIDQSANREPEKYNNIVEAFKEYREKLEIPAMNMYDEYIEKSEFMNNDIYEKFAEDLKKIRDCTGKIPEKYCDYYIAQSLKREQFYDSDISRCTLDEVIIDKSRHILESNDIKNYIVGYENNRQKKRYGSHTYSKKNKNYKNIKYRKDVNRLLLVLKNPKILNTMFHEIEHAKQCYRIQNDMISSLEYNMIKENIIEEYDKGFYKRNYKLFHGEIGARIAGKQNQYEYLAKLGFSNEEILKFDSSLDKELYENYLSFEEKLLSHTTMFKTESNEQKTVNQIFSLIIKEHPEKIKEYPCLLMEFDENGNKQCSIDILKSIDDLKNDLSNGYVPKNMKSLYNSNIEIGVDILNQPLDTDESLVGSIILEDSKKIFEYEPRTNEYKKFRDMIIENELLSSLNKHKSSKNLIVDFNESKQQSEENFNLLVNNLQEFASKNPGEDISKKITENIQDLILDKNTENGISLEKISKLVSERKKGNQELEL